MFGLEGSGFTIAIGLILLLTGVVMYYCRQKITQCEHKVDSMFSLVSSLHQELENLKRSQVNNINVDVGETSQYEEQHPYQNLIPVNVNDNEAELNESSESESDTDSETDSENENEESSYDDVKVVDLGVIEELKIDDLEEDNFAETTQFSNDNINIVEQIVGADVVESESHSDTDEEQDEDDDDEDENDTEVQVESQQQTEEGEQINNEPSEVVKMINAPDLDYSKMQVSALKKMVSDRNLASGVSKLRKQELIDILEQN
jgi:hypothetical protein